MTDFQAEVLKQLRAMRGELRATRKHTSDLVRLLAAEIRTELATLRGDLDDVRQRVDRIDGKAALAALEVGPAPPAAPAALTPQET
jgi:hypothetical protein